MVELCLQLRQFFVDFGQPLPRSFIGFLLQRFPFNLKLHLPPQNFVQLSRHRIDLRPQLGSRFIHQVDRLIRQEPVGNIPLAQNRRCHQRGILDPYPVMRFVPLPQSAQNRNRVFHRRLVDEYRLKPAFERGVFLDIFAIFVQRGGPDAMQLTARQHWFQQVARVHGPLGLPCPHHRVQFVDEQNNLPLSRQDFLEHRLQPLFKFPAKLRAGNQRAHIERDHPLFFNPSGTSPRTILCANPSTIAVLPTPGSPISTGLFFVRRDRT